MTDLRKAAERALKSLEEDPVPLNAINNAQMWLRQALAMERFSEVNQEIEEALKQLEQKPVAFLTECYNEDGDSLGYIAHTQFVYDSFPVYTAPPPKCERSEQHEWVGLTDEELPQGETYEFDRGVRWAEAKLKEKNT